MSEKTETDGNRAGRVSSSSQPLISLIPRYGISTTFPKAPASITAL